MRPPGNTHYQLRHDRHESPNEFPRNRGQLHTIGESVAAGERFPSQLAEMLRERGVKIDDPLIIAKTGWTTDELTAAMNQADVDDRTFELVTLLIGVNNQYRGRDVEEYRAQFVALLSRAIRLAKNKSARVIVLSIPDWGVTPFADRNKRDSAKVADEINLFNEVNREETEKVGARYVDITPISRTSKTRPTLLAPDGLHPSGEQYAQWAKLTLPVAIDAMSR